jgi:hypothetical protein
MYGGYDGNSSQWWYDEDFGFSSFHVADVELKLFPGTYRLVVKDTDGYEYKSYYDFNELVDLPIISSHSFRTHRVITKPFKDSPFKDSWNGWFIKKALDFSKVDDEWNRGIIFFIPFIRMGIL